MFGLIKTSINHFMEDRCVTLAASLAFYTIFSLPPLLFILATLLTYSIGLYAGGEDAEDQAYAAVQQQVGMMLGNEAAQDEIGKIMQNQSHTVGIGWKTLVSLIGVLVGATGVVAALQDSLNIVWRIKQDPVRGSRFDLIWKRVLSLGMILAVGFLLLVSFLLSMMVDTAAERVSDFVGIQPWVASAINFAIAFLVIFLTIATIFKFMPDAEILWNDVWVGALLTAVLFTLGRYVMTLYFSFSNPGEQLGSAAGALVVVLVWVYFSSMIVLFGAEFTQAWVRRTGRRVRLSPGAVHFEEKTVLA